MSNHPLKLKTIVLLVAGLTSPVFAVPPPSHFNGFYGGASTGVVQTNATISNSASASYPSLPVPFFNTDQQLQLGQNHVNLFGYSGIGAVFLGYGQFIGNSPFFLGGEIFINSASRRKSLNNATVHFMDDFDSDHEELSTTTKLKLQNTEYGFDIRPGFMMDTNTMLYGRIGVAVNNLNNRMDTSFLNEDSSPSFGDAIFFSNLGTSNTKSVFPAFRLGVGIERAVTDNLSITADYIYTYYGRVRTHGVTSTVGLFEDFDTLDVFPIVNQNGLQAESSGHMVTQAGMLGIKYYFYRC